MEGAIVITSSPTDELNCRCSRFCSRTQNPADLRSRHMKVIACAAPIGTLEPAPMTSLPLGIVDGSARASAFWSDDDGYFVRVGTSEAPSDGARWFRIADAVSEPSASAPIEDAARASAARQWIDVTPMGGGRIAFPVGSTGRTIYRVWRSKGGRANDERGTGRTRILGVRAGRSLRRPA